MEAVLIGVSDRTALWRHGKIAQNSYPQFVRDYATFLTQHFENVIVTPDDGIYTDIALAFGEQTGKKPIAYFPNQDKYYGIEHIKNNFPLYELRPIEGDWYKLNAELTKQSNVIICLGISPGVLIEGCFIKYHQKYGALKDANLHNIHWFIDKRCIAENLPAVIEEQIKNIFYYHNFNELEQLLKQKKSVLTRK